MLCHISNVQIQLNVFCGITSLKSEVFTENFLFFYSIQIFMFSRRWDRIAIIKPNGTHYRPLTSLTE
jgi:hypothetical protein